MNILPLHIRQVYDLQGKIKYLVYVNSNLVHEVDELTPGDMARLFADVYGMPVSMDTSPSSSEQPTVLTEDYLNEDNFVVFDAIDYPSKVLENHAKQLFARAITLKIIEAAQAIGLPRNALENAVRYVDNPDAPGIERLFAVQRRIDPRYAQFVGVLSWVPNQIGFEMGITDLEVKDGEFGKDGIVSIG